MCGPGWAALTGRLVDMPLTGRLVSAWLDGLSTLASLGVAPPTLYTILSPRRSLGVRA